MMRYLFLILLVLLPGQGWAQTQLKNFEAIPVLYEGRLQPLDSFARNFLNHIHGSDHVDGQSASAWLEHIITNPKDAVQQNVFYIAQPAVKVMLGLRDDQKYFSAHDLGDAFAKQEEIAEKLLAQPQDQLTPDQQEFLRVYDGLLSFTTLLAQGVPYYQDKIIASADQSRLKAEVFYNQMRPYHWALGFYALGVLLAFGAIMRDKAQINIAAFGAILAGFFCHAMGIALRVYVLQRPPVGTLYESVLFVSLICVFAALILCFRSGRVLYLLGGALAGLILLAVAPVTMPQGSSLQMLSAVLNTNFWLATHVLCITAGYGLCIITAVFAHFELFTKKEKLQKLIYILSLCALLLTCVGTILGGIWADQSWGRFWGWDPKENGALLIVLWLVWLQHGRLSRHLNARNFIAGTAFLNVIVALSWFGVNLLNVGLHSYGFTSGMAAGLLAFCLIETALIAGLWYRRGML